MSPDYTPASLVRKRKVFADLYENRVAAPSTGSSITRDEYIATLLETMHIGMESQERDYLDFRAAWPFQTIIPEHRIYLTEVREWLDQRGAHRAHWANFYEVYGFKNADDAFEFRMRWA